MAKTRPGKGDQGVYATTAAVLACLPDYVKTKRSVEKLSLREAADQIGISFNTLYRLEQGVEVRVTAARKALQWLAA